MSRKISTEPQMLEKGNNSEPTKGEYVLYQVEDIIAKRPGKCWVMP